MSSHCLFCKSGWSCWIPWLGESLSVTYVTRWSSHSIFQTNTGYSVVFFYNAAQGKNSEMRMFLGTPCLRAEMTPGKPSYFVDVFQWWTEFVLLLVAAVLSLPWTVDSCSFLFFWFCHLFDPPEQSSSSEIKLTKKFSCLVQPPEMNGVGKKIQQVSGGQKLRDPRCQCCHLSEVTFQCGLPLMIQNVKV